MEKCTPLFYLIYVKYGFGAKLISVRGALTRIFQPARDHYSFGVFFSSISFVRLSRNLKLSNFKQPRMRIYAQKNSQKILALCVYCCFTHHNMLNTHSMVVRHTTKKSKTNFNEPPHVERKKHKHGKNHLLSISASKKSIIIFTMPVHRTLCIY